jgi:hypothetical protein
MACFLFTQITHIILKVLAIALLKRYEPSMRNNHIHSYPNKYPPAEPEVLRLLAPQKGLTAIGKVKTSLFRTVAAFLEGILHNEGILSERLKQILKTYSRNCQTL